MIEQATRSLVQARLQHRRAEAPPLPDEATAYAVQQAVARSLGWFDDGPPRWWKSGGASREATLTHAPLPPAGVWRSPADARRWPLHGRWIEAEIALRLGRGVNAAMAARLDATSAAGLVDAMCVAIEIVDSRWHAALDAPAAARLADLQSHGALVLGSWRPFAPRDWRAQGVCVRIGARAPVERCGTHPLADPAWLLPAWLRHATADGITLPAGTVVTTGSWVGLLEADAGEAVQVEFDGLGSACVQL